VEEDEDDDDSPSLEGQDFVGFICGMVVSSNTMKRDSHTDNAFQAGSQHNCKLSVAG
jgi:hypothetical protein